MLESVLRAKMSFFTSTRAGSIVQRFSHDLTDVADASQWALQLGHSSIEREYNACYHMGLNLRKGETNKRVLSRLLIPPKQYWWR